MKPILYFNDKNGDSLNFGSDMKIIGYEYERNTISEKRFQESMCVFKKDIGKYRSMPLSPAWRSPHDNAFMDFREGYWLITKLIHLYDVLIEDGRFKQPFIIRNNILSGGHGRTLIGYRYFPYLVHEYITHDVKYGIGGEELVQEYVNLIGCEDDFEKECVVSLCPFEEKWQIVSVNFVTKEYLSERLKKPVIRQLDPFLEDVCACRDWHGIKSKVKSAKLNTDEDYMQLLDEIVLCRE
jgi:hypothetical protein